MMIWYFRRIIFLAIVLLLFVFAVYAAAGTLDIDTDSNDAVDIAYGGTNAATAAAARTNLGCEGADANIIKSGEIDTFAELNAIVADKTLMNDEDDIGVSVQAYDATNINEASINTFAELDTIVADKSLMNDADDIGTSVQAYDADLDTLAQDETNWVVYYKNGTTDVLTSLGIGSDGTYLKSNGATSAPSWALPGEGGDILQVGDGNPSDGNALDGSSDGGTYIRLYDGDSHYGQFGVPDLSANVTYTFPSATSTMLATDGVGTSLTALNGENIQNDTIDDDSIDFSDVTSTDFTFDADTVATTAVFSGTTSLEETTAANDSGAYVVGVYATELDLSAETNVQGVLDDLDAAIIALDTGGDGDVDSFDTTALTTEIEGFSSLNLSSITTLNLGTLDGETIGNDTIDDDSIDFADVTSTDLTFDADTVALTSVFSGTTSLEETTAADDSGAYLIGAFDEFDNSNSANVQDVLDDLDAAISVSGAPSDATYITQTANGSLSAEQALGALATGILKNTTTTGVLSIATANTDYEPALTDEASLYSTLSDVTEFIETGDQNAGTDVTADLEEEAHASEHIDGAADAIDGDKLEMSLTLDVITPDTGIAEADSADDLAAIIEGIEDFLVALDTGADGDIDSFDTTALTTEIEGFATLDLSAVDLTLPTFGDALPLYSNAAPTVNSAGELAHDSVVTGLTGGSLTWYDGTTQRYVVDLDTAPSDDGYVVSYNATSDKFEMAAAGTGTVDTSGTPVANDIAQFTDANTIKGMTYSELWAIAGMESAAEGVIDLGDLQGGVASVSNGAADTALGTAGDIHLNTTDEQLSFHSAADGEISGEASLSLIQHRMWSFDPDTICDGAVDRLFLFTIGDEAPEGIIIDEWKVSFEAVPTADVDLDLKYADAFIGVANAFVIDVLDTVSGVSSEDTDADINSGAAVANGKVLYLEFGTAYTEENHQIIFEMWYHYEED